MVLFQSVLLVFLWNLIVVDVYADQAHMEFKCKARCLDTNRMNVDLGQSLVFNVPCEERDIKLSFLPGENFKFKVIIELMDLENSEQALMSLNKYYDGGQSSPEFGRYEHASYMELYPFDVNFHPGIICDYNIIESAE